MDTNRLGPPDSAHQSQNEDNFPTVSLRQNEDNFRIFSLRLEFLNEEEKERNNGKRRLGISAVTIHFTVRR